MLEKRKCMIGYGMDAMVSEICNSTLSTQKREQSNTEIRYFLFYFVGTEKDKYPKGEVFYFEYKIMCVKY